VTSLEQALGWFNFGVLEIDADGTLAAEVIDARGKRLYRLSLAPGELPGSPGTPAHQGVLGDEALRCVRLFPQELTGVRLDGPVAFFWKSRLFVIARKHLAERTLRKRTALYEITGNLEGGPIRITEWGELPSAGDTSYAGVVRLGGARFLTTWYSSSIQQDPNWITGLVAPSDIWQATLDLARLPAAAG
jgi:hypothetical protein